MWIDVHMFSNYTVHLLTEKALPDMFPYLSCCQAEEPIPKSNRICRLH